MKPCVVGAESGTLDVRSRGGGANPTTTLFRKSDYWVDNLSHESGKRLVEKWHYSKGASKLSVYCHGLFPRDSFWEKDCVGCALWLPPTKIAALTFDPNWNGVLSLSRLVIDPKTPSNAASFLIRHSMKLIDRKRWPILISYADEWQNHTGAIYLAAGWKECGKTSPQKRYTLNGKMISKKYGSKTRTHSQLTSMGAVCVGEFRCVKFVHRIAG